MVLNRKSILARMGLKGDWKRRLVVEPFLSENRDHDSSDASIDFHLGNRFTFLRSRHAVQHDPLADPVHDVATTERFVPLGQDLSLEPGHVVLGTTLEWFRFPSDLIAYVIGRSIWGRRGLLLVTAQAVHPGSSGTITLEMSNLGDVAVRLRPGTLIGQLFFHRVEEVQEPEPPLRPRKSPFAGATRPILGEYRWSESEKLLLNL
jgi:dCTP deaminase